MLKGYLQIPQIGCQVSTIRVRRCFVFSLRIGIDALGKINSMQTLDEVVEFIVSGYPQWDLNSELVYRFMMAVRRKVGR